MPSIQQAIQKNQNRLSNPIDDPTVGVEPVFAHESPVISPMPAPPAVTGLPVRGFYPAGMTLDTDYQGTGQIARTGVNMRSPTFPPQPASVVIQKTTNKVTTVISAATSSIIGPTYVAAGLPTTTPIPSSQAPPPSSVSISVNGTAEGAAVNFSNSAPSPAAGAANVNFQTDSAIPTANISAYMPDMVGDSGAGGTSGAVPAPAAGSAAAGKYLKADGSFQVPPGTGGAANYQTVEFNTVPQTPRPNLNFVTPLVVTDNAGNHSTDISLSPSIASYHTQNLSGNISMVANTPTSVDFANFTLPSTGGPWRIFFSFAYYWQSTHTPNSQFWVTDGTNLFGGVSTGAGSNPSAASGTTWSGFTPITYANSATISLTVMAEFDTSATITRLSELGFVPASHLEYSIFSSN